MIRVTRFRTVTDPGVGGSRYVYFFTGTPWSLDGLGIFATVDRRSTEKVTRSVGA